MDPTVIVTFAWYLTNLLDWCMDITNNHPVSFWMAYYIEIEISNVYKYR